MPRVEWKTFTNINESTNTGETEEGNGPLIPEYDSARNTVRIYNFI